MTILCLMKRMSRIQGWWPPNPVKETMQHGDPRYGPPVSHPPTKYIITNAVAGAGPVLLKLS